MTMEQMLARLREIRSEIDEIYGDGTATLTDEQSARFDALETEASELRAKVEAAETRAAAVSRIRAAAERGSIEIPDGTAIATTTRHDPFDLTTLRFNASSDEVRARALTAIERVPELHDAARQRASALVGRLGPDLARRVLLTGSTAYRTGFQKAMVGRSDMWDPEERDAFRAALSLTDANGGFAVPFTLDPTVISTNDVSTNPFRRISRTVSTVTNDWNGITSAGVTASFDAEAAEVSDDSPTLGQPNIPVHMARAFARGSIEISQDWASIETDLRTMFQEAKDDLEGTVFTTGTGTNQPTGIITALTGTASEINAAADDTFAIGDVYTVEAALPPKYRLARMDGDTTTSRASWIANHAIYNLIRRFDTAGGAGLWETLGGGLPPKLLGYPAYEASAMDSSVTTTGAVSNLILAIGDFRNYVIVDRIGFNLEFIPHLFATANNLPSGQRGWFAYWRVGADSVNDDAFRLLDVASAA